MNARYKVCPQVPDRISSGWPQGLGMPVWSYRSFPSARRFAEKEAMNYTFGLVVYDVEKQRIHDGEEWVSAEEWSRARFHAIRWRVAGDSVDLLWEVKPLQQIK